MYRTVCNEYEKINTRTGGGGGGEEGGVFCANKGCQCLRGKSLGCHLRLRDWISSAAHLLGLGGHIEDSYSVNHGPQ
jgi:hypothetical protein